MQFSISKILHFKHLKFFVEQTILYSLVEFETLNTIISVVVTH